jgi:hypothetical protein
MMCAVGREVIENVVNCGRRGDRKCCELWEKRG